MKTSDEFVIQNEMTNQLSQERTDHAEILKTLENTKLKRKIENLTHEKIEARNEVKLVWKEKDEATKGSFYSESTDEFVISQIIFLNLNFEIVSF